MDTNHSPESAGNDDDRLCMIWIKSSAQSLGGCPASLLMGSSNTTLPTYRGSSELRQLLDPDAMAGPGDTDRWSLCVPGVGGNESSVDDARHESCEFGGSGS